METKDEDELYPSSWENLVLLNDGSVASIRPIRSSDRLALAEFHKRQSERSRYLRFFMVMPELSEADLTKFTEVDHQSRVALLAFQSERLIAVARFDGITTDSAEVAFNVADDFQGKGVGSILLEQLSEIARNNGITKFVAEVLPENGRMVSLFKRIGFRVEQQFVDGFLEVSVDIKPDLRYQEAFEAREQRAELNSVKHFLAASHTLFFVGKNSSLEDATKVLASFQQLSNAGNSSVLYIEDADSAKFEFPPSSFISSLPPVEERSGSTLAFFVGSVGDLARSLPALTTQGVTSLVIASYLVEDQQLAAVISEANSRGMRVLGPGSLGVSTFRKTRSYQLIPGLSEASVADGLAVFSHGDFFSRRLLSLLKERDLTPMEFASSGQKYDVSGNDFLQLWENDETISMLLMQLESIGNPRKFLRLAKRVSLKKPVIVFFSETENDADASTLSLESINPVFPRFSNRVPNILCAQAGVLLAENIEEAVFLTSILQQTGEKSSISSLTRKAAILTDSVELHNTYLSLNYSGLEVFHYLWDFENTLEDENKILQQLKQEKVTVLFWHQIGSTASKTSLTKLRKRLSAELLIIDLSTGATAITTLAKSIVKVIENQVVRELNKAVSPAITSLKLAYPEQQIKLEERLELQQLLSATSKAKILTDTKSNKLLGRYGLQVLPSSAADSEDQLLASARSLPGPFALKSSYPELRHRTDLDGVQLNLGSENALKRAYGLVRSAQIKNPLSEEGNPEAVILQPMAAAGVACLVTCYEDEIYGPVIAFGLAGESSELLGDVSIRVTPISLDEATEMIFSLQAKAKLIGSAGNEKFNFQELAELLVKVSILKNDFPELYSITLKPVLVSAESITILQAELAVKEQSRRDGARRSLIKRWKGKG